MKYPKITSLVPAGEHFDESAVGEGVYLTATHLKSIEDKLAEPVAVDPVLQEQLDTANASVTSLQEQVKTMHTAESVKTLNERITTLEAENKELGKKSSGPGTPLPVGEEEQETGGENKKVSLSDPKHPLNVAVAQEISAKKNAKDFKKNYNL
jgi:predicted nuclease with TOPRIM domain